MDNQLLVAYFNKKMKELKYYSSKTVVQTVKCDKVLTAKIKINNSGLHQVLVLI